MIKSMTGFGRCELSNEKRKITVELKSVNHRYLDVNIRMPKKLNFFESAIRTLLKEYMQRGKVDMFISYEDYSEQTLAVKYNATIAKEYLTYLQQMADEFSLKMISASAAYPVIRKCLQWKNSLQMKTNYGLICPRQFVKPAHSL